MSKALYIESLKTRNSPYAYTKEEIEYIKFKNKTRESELRKLIRNFSDKDWRIDDLIHNPQLTPGTMRLFIKDERYRSYLLPYFQFGILEFQDCIKLSVPRIYQYIDFRYWSTIATWEDVVKHPTIQWDFSRLSGNPNITLDIILKFRFIPETNLLCEWNIVEFQFNPNFSVDMVEKHPYLNWSYYHLSRNRLTDEFVGRNLVKKWDWDSLVLNKTLSWSFLRKHLNKVSHNVVIVHSGILLEDVIKYSRHLWGFREMSVDPLLDYRIVNSFPERVPEKARKTPYGKDDTSLFWSWSLLSKNVAVPIEYIFSNLHLPWNMETIWSRADLTLELVKRQKVWDCESLSGNPNVTYEFVTENPHPKWDMIILFASLPLKEVEKFLAKGIFHVSISSRFDLSLAFVERYSYPWDWLTLSRTIPWKDIITNLHKPWDLDILSTRTELTPKDVLDYPDLWNYRLLSMNESITADLVVELKDKDWDFDRLKFNRFDLGASKISTGIALETEERIKTVWPIFLSINHPVCIPDIFGIVKMYIGYQ